MSPRPQGSRQTARKLALGWLSESTIASPEPAPDSYDFLTAGMLQSIMKVVGESAFSTPPAEAKENPAADPFAGLSGRRLAIVALVAQGLANKDISRHGAAALADGRLLGMRRSRVPARSGWRAGSGG